MIRCTRNLLLILVAAFTLIGCTPLAPRIVGSQFTSEIVASAASAGSAPTTETMITSTRVASATSAPAASPTHTVSSTATAQPTATPSATASASPTQPAPTYTPAPTVTPTPTVSATPESPAVLVESAANIRSGPGTAYPIIGGARARQRLPVIAQNGGWFQITTSELTGWIWGALVTPNAAARQAPRVTNLPPLPPTQTPAPTAVPSPQPVAQADLVVLGPETHYPVRARVVRGWDYELVDASTSYDFVVQRDVFGMLAHQLDAERVTRYHRPSFFSFTPDGVFRIYLVDWVPHPNAECAARGYGTTALVDFGGDPLGLNTNVCLDNHSLYPLGDGEGAAIGYRCNGQCALAVAAPGGNLASLVLTAFAEALPRPATLGPAGRADFGSEAYRPLGQGRWDATLWRWADPFVEVVPAGR